VWIDWPWAAAHGSVVSIGWKAGTGFLSYGWEGYSEALLLYVLGLGSPTHPLPGLSPTRRRDHPGSTAPT
jgi:hypothetical protein